MFETYHAFIECSVEFQRKLCTKISDAGASSCKTAGMLSKDTLAMLYFCHNTLEMYFRSGSALTIFRHSARDFVKNG